MPHPHHAIRDQIGSIKSAASWRESASLPPSHPPTQGQRGPPTTLVTQENW